MSTKYDLIKTLLGEQGDQYYEKTLELTKKRLVYSLVPAFNNNLKIYKKLCRYASNYKNRPEEVNFDSIRKFIMNSLLFAGMIREIDEEEDKVLLRNYLAMYSMIYEKNKQLFDLIQELKTFLGVKLDVF